MTAAPVPNMPANVRAAFDRFPVELHPGLEQLRGMIFEVAARTPDAGEIAEDLRWGQPAYLTSASGSGTTVRLGVTRQGEIAVYVHCQTTVIEDFRAVAPEGLQIEGNRAVVLRGLDEIRTHAEPLAWLIRAALTYHIR